ncbi:hypothetical protein DIS24_g11086 [Lasiodiplodia hormozganensis]|uniref:Lipocalin-like domain-containing protein n=1 Tax=Lasiodiplodia hormozganensis TaxID=869390 RepID=A0AA40C5A8_9PEZI|nr:hypothetical protein DIS24_g11086 [Lasiodiplodia hormozganensis]
MHPENALSLLVGTWSLLNISSTQNGVPNLDPGLGPHPTGLVHYHPDGYMAAVLASTTPQDRPKNLTWQDRAPRADADWARVGKHSIAYTGPYRLNASVPVVATERGVEGQVVHGPLDVATLPSFMGTFQPRDFELVFCGGNRTGGEGTLLQLHSDLGKGTKMSLWWEKV